MDQYYYQFNHYGNDFESQVGASDRRNRNTNNEDRRQGSKRRSGRDMKNTNRQKEDRNRDRGNPETEVGDRNDYDGYRMNGEQYCESEHMRRNEDACRASSCCHWNTEEQGDASFNGEGRCWSRIGQDMCFDMDEEHQMQGYNKYNRYNGHYNRYGRSYDSYRMNGEQYCESEFMIRNEQGCRASSCCHWNTHEQGDASFNGEGRCWSRIGQDMCFDMDEEYQMEGYN